MIFRGFPQLVHLSSNQRNFCVGGKGGTADILLGGLSQAKFYFLTEKSCPFIRDVLCPRITDVSVGMLTMLLPFKKSFVGNVVIPCLHGGVAAAIIDHVGGFCAWTTLDNSFYRLNTVDLKVDYLLPAPCEDMIVEARVIHRSKKLIRCDVDCWNKDRTKKIAVGRCLYNAYESKDDISLLLV